MILASRSPRRRELLSGCGVEFSVHDARVEELQPGCGLPLRELPAANAVLKAEAVSAAFPDELVLAADTMVICNGSAFGKPADETQAMEMLRSLSGRDHEVITAVALMKKSSGFRKVWSEVTRVRFKELSAEDIRKYISLVDVCDKAGAYAIQEHGEMLVEMIDGEIENVIGLPLKKLQDFLKNG